MLVLAEYSGPVAEAVGAKLGDFPYRVTCPHRSACDLLIASSQPIEDLGEAVSGLFSVAFARLDLAGTPVDLMGVHLTRPIPLGHVERQMAQIDAIAEVLQARPETALVVAGDFNAVPWGRVMRHFVDVTGLALSRSLGLEGSWPSPLPWPLRLPIDHLLTNGTVAPVSRRQIHVPGSDHRAVVVDIAIVAAG